MKLTSQWQPYLDTNHLGLTFKETSRALFREVVIGKEWRSLYGQENYDLFVPR